jgi:hypothetical protein
MAGFKSPNQRRFIFASEKDKTLGQNSQQIPPQKSSPIGMPTSHPLQLPGMPQQQHFQSTIPAIIHPTANPSMHLPKPGSLNPTAVPALPGMPKFGRMKKYLK